MKIKRIIFIVMCGFLLGCGSTPNKADCLKITIEGEKRNFGLSDSVSISVSNVTSEKMYYIVGLEQNFKSEWIEYISDISNRYHQGVAIKKLAGSETAAYKWPNDHTDLVQRPDSITRPQITLRVVVSYSKVLPRNHNEVVNLPKIYSETFTFGK